jgi:iron complex transport system permease protein
MQGLTRNPLADPGILGVNAGAALCVVLGIHVLGIGSTSAFVWLALLGGLAAATLVYAVSAAAPGGPAPLTMALAGAALSAGAVSVVAGVLVSNRGALDTFRFWQVGSVAGRSADLVVDVLPLLLGSLVVVALSGPVLNATALGDDLERALGQRVHLARGVVALGAVGLAACAVALAGPIGFVGLVVPHLVRLVTGPDYRRILLGSALVGPVLVLLTDTLGRVVMPPSEIQVGIMTAVLGAPGLIWLVRRTAVR